MSTKRIPASVLHRGCEHHQLVAQVAGRSQYRQCSVLEPMIGQDGGARDAVRWRYPVGLAAVRPRRPHGTVMYSTGTEVETAVDQPPCSGQSAARCPALVAASATHEAQRRAPARR